MRKFRKSAVCRGQTIRDMRLYVRYLTTRKRFPKLFCATFSTLNWHYLRKGTKKPPRSLERLSVSEAFVLLI